MPTFRDLAEGFESLGARPTSCLMVHGSLSRFGHVDGGAQTVIDALARGAGADGAVIAPSFCDAIRSDHYALRQCASVCPHRLCPSRERGFTGIIGETLRQQPGSLRSCHPTHSWVGIGVSAAFLLEGHRSSLTPCGRDSPFFRLLMRDGLILLLGVGVNSLTNLHAVEDARNVPYLSAIDPPRRHATYTTSGRRIQYRYPQLLHQALEQCGIIRTRRIGDAACHALEARRLGSFLWVATEADPWCLVLRPRGDRYAPESDAQAKCEAMVHAWKGNPDDRAWQRLLEASAREMGPVLFAPAQQVQTSCPAYCGVVRGHHRCSANDLPPWERFEDYPADEPGVATCQQCNWSPHA